MKIPPTHRLQVVVTGDGQVTVRYYVDAEFGPPAGRRTAVTNRDLEISGELKKAIKDLLSPLLVQNLEAMDTLAHRDAAQLAYVTSLATPSPELAKATLPSVEETPDDQPANRKRSRSGG